jgi:hypothetical protein
MVELIKRNTTKLVWHFSNFSTISYDFSKFTEKEKEKGFELLQKGPWEVLNQSNWVLGHGQRGRRWLTGRFR